MSQSLAKSFHHLADQIEAENEAAAMVLDALAVALAFGSERELARLSIKFAEQQLSKPRDAKEEA